MKKRVEFLEVESGNATHLKVEVYYDKGGANYFTGGVNKRGLYLSVSPVKRSVSNGLVTESYTAFSGVKQFVKEMARFSQKALDSFVIDENVKNELIRYVCKQNNIVLK